MDAETFPPGTTGALVDELRGMLEAYRVDAADTAYQIPHGVHRMATLLDRAADHIDDLAAKLLSAEDDIARLHHLACTYERNLEALGEWVNAAKNLLPHGAPVPRPHDIPSEHWTPKAKEPTP